MTSTPPVIYPSGLSLLNPNTLDAAVRANLLLVYGLNAIQTELSLLGFTAHSAPIISHYLKAAWEELKSVGLDGASCIELELTPSQCATLLSNAMVPNVEKRIIDPKEV